MSAAKFDKLSDDNYIAWSKRMRAYLIKQDVWGIVSGNDEKPVGSPNSKAVKAWTRKRDIAAAEILLHVSEKYISHCDDHDPTGTWECFQQLFCAQGQSSVAALRRDFYSMMKRPEETMRGWITRVEDLLYQLRELGSAIIDIDIINTLTRGIGEEYNPLLVQFDTLIANHSSPNPITIPYVIQRLINEEKRHHTPALENLYVNYSSTHTKNSKAGTRVCYHCGEEGHVRSECDVTPRALHERKRKGNALADAKVNMASAEEADVIEQVTVF